MPAATVCLESGRVETGQLDTARLDAPLIFRVYLPPCYDRQLDTFFPVLYLLHGQGFSDEQWERMGVVQVAETLMAQGDIPPLLIVMPAEQDHYAPPERNPYGEVLVDELLPYIEANYRVRPERAYRAIGGVSRGGNWALYLGVQRWDVFAAVGAHSTPFFRTHLPADLRAWVRAIPAGRWPRFFLDAGMDDPGLEPILRVEQVLTEEGIPHEWHLNRGAHDEAYWSAHLRDYLLWYTEQW
ncbi:MAG: hypothetical protein D6803_04610 [Anaerolineae bacterium]|nr:MAG: hypothetical protein D6803_04610 [Anaerolineae bacterium]